MTLYTGTVLGHEPEDVQFHDLGALARRLGGDDYQLEESTAFEPTYLIAMITRTDKYGTHVVCRVSIPPKAAGDRPRRGRPEVGPPVHIRLTPELLAELDAWAEGQGMTRAAAARHILETSLDEMRKQQEAGPR